MCNIFSQHTLLYHDLFKVICDEIFLVYIGYIMNVNI